MLLESIGNDWRLLEEIGVVVDGDIGAAFVSQHCHLLGAPVDRWCEPAQVFA